MIRKSLHLDSSINYKKDFRPFIMTCWNTGAENGGIWTNELQNIGNDPFFTLSAKGVHFGMRNLFYWWCLERKWLDYMWPHYFSNQKMSCVTQLTTKRLLNLHQFFLLILLISYVAFSRRLIKRGRYTFDCSGKR